MLQSVKKNILTQIHSEFDPEAVWLWIWCLILRPPGCFCDIE